MNNFLVFDVMAYRFSKWPLSKQIHKYVWVYHNPNMSPLKLLLGTVYKDAARRANFLNYFDGSTRIFDSDVLQLLGRVY